MSQLNLIQTNFTSGEISPSMYGRVDVSKYANGAETLQNMIVKPQGGAYRRPGTKFVGFCGLYSGAGVFTFDCMLIPFIFNTTQSYILEIIATKMYVWKNDAAQESPPGTKKTYAAPWAGYHVKDLKFCQSADTLFVFHPYYPVYKITRDVNENFAVTRMDFIDGPYLSNDEAGVVQLLNYTHTGVITRTVGVAPIFAGADVGKFVEYRQDGTWKLAKITAFTSATQVSVQVMDNVMIDFDSRVKIRSRGTGRFFFDPTTGQWIARNALQRPAGERYVPPAGAVSFAAATVTSNYADTFTRGDIGKYIRPTTGASTWIQITGFISSTQVNGVAVTMTPYTYPASQVELSVEARAARLTVALGTNYFIEASPLSGSTLNGLSANIGRHVRLNFGSRWIWGKLANFVGGDPNSFDIMLYEDPPLDPNDATIIFGKGVPDSWRLGAWAGFWAVDDFWGPGWPGIGTFHEQRLTTARSLREPQTVWMSESGVYNSFSPTEIDSTVNDDNAIAYTMVSRQLNKIQWVESGPVLLIGTSGGEWQVKAASSIAAPLSPMNISVTPQSNVGSIDRTDGQRINAAVLFINRSGRRCMHMQYNFELDQFITKDLTILSDHVLGEGGTRSTYNIYQQEPNSLMWIVRDDGNLACLTYQPEQEVYAWTKHHLGTNGFTAVVETMASIPSPDGTEDYVYMVVRRFINGQNRRYLERLHAAFPSDGATFDSQKIFLDCSLDFTTGSPTTSITGLTYMIGETVSIWGDGMYQGTGVVNGSGILTLPLARTNVRVGYSFTSKLRTIRPEAPGPQGTSQGRMKRTHQVAIRLRDSYNFKIGYDDSNMFIAEATNETGLEVAPSAALFSGDRKYLPEQPWSLSGQLQLIQDLPYNLHVTSIMPVVTANE